MKKFGFTLAEVLITLSIIAIAAATLAPSYLKSRPDKYKFKVVKCYNTIADANERLLGNPFVYEQSMLSSTGVPDTATGFTSYTDASGTKCKYPLLMGEILNLEPDGSCNTGVYKGKSSDATIWEFYTTNGKSYIISVTFPRSDGTSCSYNATTCKYPNVFKFKVDVYGDVFAADDDPLTKAFLKNVYNIHQKEDYDAISN